MVPDMLHHRVSTVVQNVDLLRWNLLMGEKCLQRDADIMAMGLTLY